ncbi:hypothetical protein [Embleya sp. NPDC005575]|uniref:hypothetical protein n=1 Tax=Embleya sp. NPDC005575 TaxID=3156892 RepID=UPI0033AF017F
MHLRLDTVPVSVPPRSTRRAVLVTLALLGTFIGLVVCLHEPRRPPDEGGIDPYLRRYVGLLNARDTDGLRGRLHSHQARTDAAVRVAVFGGQGWSDVGISREREFYGVYRVLLTAVRTDTGARVAVVEHVVWGGDNAWSLSPYVPGGAVAGPGWSG